MEEILTRQIKVFCPQHQSVFEVADTPKIVCEIREHTLSNNFPNAEFWEYCCDCQTFFPSNLEVGGKTKENCLQCERPPVSRFVCGNCKIVSYDSGEQTKGKIFNVNADSKTVEPSCPGCQKSFVGAKIYQHNCADIEIVLLTPRETCPFCKRLTIDAKPIPVPKVQNSEPKIQPKKSGFDSFPLVKTVSPKTKPIVQTAPVKPNSSSTLSLDSANSHYEGKIGGQIFSMVLARDGRSLTGTVTRAKTEILIGTIDDDGNFSLDSFANGNQQTGGYKGRIFPNGSIRGNWTNAQGRQGTSFFLTQHYHFRR